MYYVIYLFAFLGAVNSRVIQESENSSLSILVKWNQLDYVWTAEHNKEMYIQRNLYIPAKIIPTDLARAEDGRIFIVTPIIKESVPATLSFISENNNLVPYPDWSWHNKTGNCSRNIINAKAIVIDQCQRLWVLDSGFDGESNVCSPKLLAFDTFTNKIVHIVTIDHENPKVTANQKVTNLDVAVAGSTCENTTVYVSDAGNNAVHVIQITSNKIAKILNVQNDFKPDENYSTITIANQTFDINFGIVGLSLTPLKDKTEPRHLYLRPLASRSLFSCNSMDLTTASETACKKIENVLQSQGTAQAFTNSGTLYYGLSNSYGIGCWNKEKGAAVENFKIAVSGSNLLEWIGGLKIVTIDKKETLLVLSIRLDRYLKNNLSSDETNFYILSAPISNFKERCD